MLRFATRLTSKDVCAGLLDGSTDSDVYGVEDIHLPSQVVVIFAPVRTAPTKPVKTTSMSRKVSDQDTLSFSLDQRGYLG